MSLMAFVGSMHAGLHKVGQAEKRAVRNTNEQLLAQILKQLKETPEETPHEIHIAFIFAAMNMFGDELEHSRHDDEGFMNVFIMSMISMERISVNDFKGMFPKEEGVIGGTDIIPIDEYDAHMKRMGVDENAFMDLRSLALLVRYPNKRVQNTLNRYVKLVKYEIGDENIDDMLKTLMDEIRKEDA